MRKFPTPIHNAMGALGRFPGVGPKTALRYVFALLRLSKDEIEIMARAIEGLKYVSECERCYTFAEKNICDICSEPQRNQNLICVVGEARDISTIEATGIYRGLYFVLGGVLNPIDGQTPDTLNVDRLMERLKREIDVKEIILAFSPDVHGETTILYLTRLIKGLGRRTTRLARGLPMGADIEYADEVTLASALSGRSET